MTIFLVCIGVIVACGIFGAGIFYGQRIKAAAQAEEQQILTKLSKH
jgi:hypothetical protein